MSHDHSHGPGAATHAHDAAHDIEHVRQSVRKYLYVFYALGIGTIITVLASFVDFGSRWMNVTIALIIATIKAGLVAGFFMHLISERKLIYSLLTCTFFFFGAMMFIFIWCAQDFPGSEVLKILTTFWR
jgi:cytochrome c oxidase subunit 4